MKSLSSNPLHVLLKGIRLLAEHAFVFTILLMIISAAISGLIYFSALSATNSMSTPNTTQHIRKDIFSRIIETWKDRAEKAREADSFIIKDVFEGGLTEEE